MSAASSDSLRARKLSGLALRLSGGQLGTRRFQFRMVRDVHRVIGALVGVGLLLQRGHSRPEPGDVFISHGVMVMVGSVTLVCSGGCASRLGVC